MASGSRVEFNERSGIGFRHLLVDNPVTVKELRGRMRGARAFTVLTVYLLLLGVLSVLIYVAVTESSTSVSGQVIVGEIGRTLFGGIVAVELLLVSFVAPAFTAGAISGEREHQTFELLRTTLLPAYALVTGKLVSSMLYVLLLLLAAIPLQSIAFFFGGVAETEVILSIVILVMTAFLFSAIGIYFSARSKRTLSASVQTYGLIMFILFGLPLVLGVVMVLADPSFDSVEPGSLQMIMIHALWALVNANPIIVAVLMQYLLVNGQTGILVSYTPVGGQSLTLVSPWIPFVAIYAVLTLIFVLLASRRVSWYSA